MAFRGLTPILNVSDLAATFEWFEAFGWSKLWDWGDPPGFGAVGAGPSEIFLCEGAQGGRGKSDLSVTTGAPGAESADGGVWMSLWVDDVDEVHARCLERGLEVTHPPTNEAWNVREMHVRHPDGHVFRVSRGLSFEDPVRSPIPVQRVAVPVRLEQRLAALLTDVAEAEGSSMSALLERIVLHSFEQVGRHAAPAFDGDGFARIEELKEHHGIDYGTHGSEDFVEENASDS